MVSGSWAHLPAAYDAVAGDYAAMFSDELDRKPFDRELHVDNWFERGVSFDATLFNASELVQLVTDAGFAECQATVRDPYEGEYPSSRLYIHAT